MSRLGKKAETLPAKSPRERREARRIHSIIVGLTGVLLTMVGMTLDYIPATTFGIWLCLTGVIIFVNPRQQAYLYMGLGWLMVFLIVLWLAWDPGYYYYYDEKTFVIRGLGFALAAAAGLWLVTCGASNVGTHRTYVQEAASGPCSAWLSQSTALEVRYCDSCGRMIWSLSASCYYCNLAKPG